MLVAGVRYRFANGLRSAMRLWGALLVAFAVAEGLRAAPPLVAWAKAWMATPFPRRLLLDGGVALAFGLLARSMFLSTVGAWGAEQLAVLPLTRGRRFAIDYVSTLLFLMPPLVAMVGLSGRVVPVVVMLIAALLGGGGRRVVSLPSSAASRHLLAEGEGFAFPLVHEWRWLLRGGRDRLLIAIGGSTLVAASSFLAIRNNGVTSALAVLRIESGFLAFAAGVLGPAILAARDAMRPYRIIETIVPLSSSTRLRTLLTTSLPLLLAPLSVVALLRFSPVALVYGVVVFAEVLLFGEASSLRGKRGESAAMAVSIVAAVGGALDARVALAIAFVLLPVAWWQATTADATSDLRVVRTEVAA